MFSIYIIKINNLVIKFFFSFVDEECDQPDEIDYIKVESPKIKQVVFLFELIHLFLSFFTFNFSFPIEKMYIQQEFGCIKDECPNTK